MSDPYPLDSDHSQRCIAAVLELQSQLYRAAAVERRSIHEQEYIADQDYSILGIIELLSTEIAGYASQVVSSHLPTDWSIIFANLRARELRLYSAELADWLVSNPTNYPMLCSYVAMVDYLRLLLIELASLKAKGRKGEEKGSA